jgi:hypothetical protein
MIQKREVAVELLQDGPARQKLIAEIAELRELTPQDTKPVRR